jgi:hypothetical protein
VAGFARTKAGSPQFTGIVERYRKTILNAFHRIAFRKKFLRRWKDLHVWTKEYEGV